MIVKNKLLNYSNAYIYQDTEYITDNINEYIIIIIRETKLII